MFHFIIVIIIIIETFIYLEVYIIFMQNNDSLKDIWELYGVKENPFSTSPILVVGGSISIDSFVGRSEHIKRLSKIGLD